MTFRWYSQALEDSGALRNIRRFVGTSAGAVIGGMLVVGATSQEIADFFKCDVKKLFQGQWTGNSWVNKSIH
jgi:predicted acylesterase/phospholipase RssA